MPDPRVHRLCIDAAKDKDDAAHKVKLDGAARVLRAQPTRSFGTRVRIGVAVRRASHGRACSITASARSHHGGGGGRSRWREVAQAQVADETVRRTGRAPTTPGTKRMLTSEWKPCPPTFSPAVSDGERAREGRGRETTLQSPGIQAGATPRHRPWAWPRWTVTAVDVMPELVQPEVEAAAEEEAARGRSRSSDERRHRGRVPRP